MKSTLKTLSLIGIVLLGVQGCAQSDVATSRGVYMLVDTSGTYTKELEKAEAIVNFVLAKLNPGDSFALARINTGSFTEKDIVAKVSFDDRPTMANTQKRSFHESVDRFIKGVKSSAYTDVTGGLLQAIEFLNEKNPGHKTVLIFSDLKEELDTGYVRDIPLHLNDVDVVALNVTKLHSDNVDPREYMARLEMWRKRVESGGGHWRVINDLDKLDTLLGQV